MSNVEEAQHNCINKQTDNWKLFGNCSVNLHRQYVTQHNKHFTDLILLR